MKKWLDRSVWFHGVGVLLLLTELTVVSTMLTRLNVLSYLLVIGIIPAAVLFMCSLLHGACAKTAPLSTYLAAVLAALLFAGVMLLYCGSAITPELMDTILTNSITSDTAQVSMTEASAGDNIQSILIFVAFSGVGAFLGNYIRRKRGGVSSAVAGRVVAEYDT